MGLFTSTKPVAAPQAIDTASLLATFPAVHAANVSPPQEASDTRVKQSLDRLFAAQGLAHDSLRTDMPLRGRFNPLDAFPRVDL